MTTTPTHTEIQPCTFLDDGVFATKTGEAGIVLKLSPHDSECMDAADLAATTKRFSAAMRLIGPEFRVYQYLIKRRLPRAVKEHYSFDVWLVLLRKGVDVAAVRQVARAFVMQLGDLIPAWIAGKSPAYSLFRSLLNYDHAVANIPLKYNEHIGYYASDSPIEGHRGYVRVGDHFAKVLTLKDPPQGTAPDLLRPLREIPCECIVVTEWVPGEMQAVRSAISKKTSHFHRSKYAMNILGSLITKFSANEQRERPEDMQKDESATAMESQLGQLMVDIEKNGTQVGEFALTVIVFGLDKAQVDTAASEAFKALASREAVLYEERHNVLAAWFAAIPGGHQRQHRSMYLTNHNYADLSMLFAPATGDMYNHHLGAEYLAVLETRQQSPYYANLHYGDVGHTLISGMTGSGKSYLANHLLLQAVEKYDARVVIFDIGGSYQALTERIGGSYMEVGLTHDFTINPFSALWPVTMENRHFQFSFVKVLIESGEHRMTDVEQDALYRAIPGVGRLRDLVPLLPEELRPYLSRWTGDGQYAALFDNAEDTLTCAHFQAFDFEGLEKFPEILEPLLFYVLHRANAGIYDNAARGEFKIFLLDEAWRFLLNPTVKAYIYESLKTWRKRNAAMWLATQSIGDLEQSEMLQTVAENCGTIVLLPNPRMDREHYRSVFKLNDTELDMVATMQPKRESLWKPAVGESKVLRLEI